MANRRTQILRKVEENKKTKVITINDIFTSFKKEMMVKNLMPKTKKSYEITIMHFIDYLSNIGITSYDKITLSVINGYVVQRTNDVSPSNAKRFIKYYCTMLRTVEKCFPDVDTSKLSNISKPQSLKKQRFAYTDDDVAQIYRVTESYDAIIGQVICDVITLQLVKKIQIEDKKNMLYLVGLFSLV